MRGCTCFPGLGLWPRPRCGGRVKGKMVLALVLENCEDDVIQDHRQGRERRGSTPKPARTRGEFVPRRRGGRQWLKCDPEGWG